MQYPKLPSEIRRLNRQLESHFGIDTASMRQMWRVVWAPDQIEKRLSKFSPGGIELLTEQQFEFPKYQWVGDKWILENLVVVPETNRHELCDITTSYECLWAFPHKDKKPLIPTFEACKFVVDLVNSVKGKQSMAKYVDEEAKNPIESREKRIQELVEQLYGDESNLLGMTVTGEAIAMPQEYGQIAQTKE